MLREAMAENMYACTLLLPLAANMCATFLIVCMCTPGAQASFTHAVPLHVLATHSMLFEISLEGKRVAHAGCKACMLHS